MSKSGLSFENSGRYLISVDVLILRIILNHEVAVNSKTDVTLTFLKRVLVSRSTQSITMNSKGCWNTSTNFALALLYFVPSKGSVW